MRVRRSVFIAAPCVLAGIVLAVLLTGEKEPSYQGRTLSEWLHTFPNGGIPGGTVLTNHEAIKHIGTNAIPTLLRWISYDPSQFRQEVLQLSRKLPRALVPPFLQRPEKQVFDAHLAFATLGPIASPAIPSLVDLVITSRSDPRARACLFAILAIGQDSLPALITVANTTNAPLGARFTAISLIPMCGTNAVTAIPTLVRLLDDNSSAIAVEAAQMLAALPPEFPDTAVPGLTAQLQSTNARLREYSARALGGYAKLATSAVPLLKPLLLDRSESVREQTMTALKSIAPEVLTNAPPQ